MAESTIPCKYELMRRRRTAIDGIDQGKTCLSYGRGGHNSTPAGAVLSDCLPRGIHGLPFQLISNLTRECPSVLISLILDASKLPIESSLLHMIAFPSELFLSIEQWLRPFSRFELSVNFHAFTRRF